MRRAERMIPLLAAGAVAGAALILSVSLLPRFAMTEIDVSGPVSAKHLFLPLRGKSLFSPERYRAEKAAASLPYAEGISFGFRDGKASFGIGYKEGGVLILSPDEALVSYPEGSYQITREDAAGLLACYPAIELDAMPDTLPDSLIRHIEIVRSLGNASLISWIKYCNIDSDSFIKLYIPSLRAYLSVMDGSSADRIKEAIGLIKEKRTGLILHDEDYELYRDRLVRVRSCHGVR